MAAKVKGVPDNSSVVIPRLFCRDPASAIGFYASTFDAVDDCWSSILSDRNNE